MATLQASTPSKVATPTIPILSTTVGATFDAFYRSAMNAKLNSRLTNAKAPLFPNMHIQTPVRIIYMNGIKNLRLYLETRVKPKLYEQGYNSQAVKFGLTLTPGLVMTPFSSILEASNAGHMNPEPMSSRWIRGLLPRTVREVIFAAGLNQVSDWCKDQVPDSVTDPTARSVAGSIAAGSMAGYFSHVPHNLSTLKLLKPQVSYGDHFRSLLQATIDARFDKQGSIYRSNALKNIVGTSLVFLMPRGVIIRTAQIVGSFVIVNGTISLFDIFGVNQQLSAVATPVASLKAAK